MSDSSDESDADDMARQHQAAAEDAARWQRKLEQFRTTAGLETAAEAEEYLRAASNDVRSALAQVRRDGTGMLGKHASAAAPRVVHTSKTSVAEIEDMHAQMEKLAVP